MVGLEDDRCTHVAQEQTDRLLADLGKSVVGEGRAKPYLSDSQMKTPKILVVKF